MGHGWGPWGDGDLDSIVSSRLFYLVLLLTLGDQNTPFDSTLPYIPNFSTHR